MTDFPSSPISARATALIDRRLEDLAEANAIYGKDQRLNAPDKIARNDREISWLKDLRSEVVLIGVAQTGQQWQPIDTAPENHLPVQVYGLYGQLVAFRDVHWVWWLFPNGEDPLNYTPTHWKPLGSNPSDTSTDRGGK